MPNIVNVIVKQQVASAPSTLQRTGAFVSQGATTLTAGTYQLLTQLSDLTSILSSGNAISTITWASSVVTVTTATAHGIPTGNVIQGIISGVTPTAYSGTFAVTSTGTTTLTYALTTNPGAATVTASSLFSLEDSQELLAMGTTFFAQGATTPVYVLELGTGTPAAGVTALTTFINTSNFKFYSYLLPATWNTEATAVTMARLYTSTTAQTYFYVTTTLATYTAWAGIKSVLATVQSPSAPVIEFSAAAIFQATLSYNPSASNLASPLEYTFVYGVTSYSTLTNAQQTELLTAGVNYIYTGAQGQISNTLIEGGTFMDLNPFNYWYAIDWLAINVAISLAAAIINGSNLSTNPLYYNQAGINALQKVAQATTNNGIAFGLILSPARVGAIAFNTYVSENPSDYAAGIYKGLSLTFVPQRGFSSITIYLTASNIPT